MGHKIEQSLVNSRIDFFYYAFRNVLLVSIPLLVISGVVLSHLSLHSSATVSGASADSLTLSLPTSCTLSSVVNSAHNATLISGTYTSDIGKTTITTLCNDGNGYAIYANGLSNGTVGNNALMSSVSSNHNIATGIYEQGDTASSWAMKLGNVSGDTSPTPPVIEQGYNNTYGLVPGTWTKVAGRQSGTTDMITGSTFTTTYAVYTAPTQHAGTYTGQVAYALIHGSGDNVGTLHFMQNVSEWQNEIPNPGDTLQAMDTRDGKQYWVTRLADGHIWMTQNLDFDIDATKTYTHNDTDLGWNPNSFDSNATWQPDTTNGKYNLPVNGTSVPGWSNQNNYPYSVDPGDVYYYTSNSTSDDIEYASLSDCTSAGHTADECKHYHVGNYYNWTAAIASNNSVDISTNEARASNSICPKGWRLPNTDTQDSIYNEFGRLFYSYNIINNKSNSTNSINYKAGGFDAVRVSPLWFLRSGLIGDGMLLNAPARGYYWSNMAASQYNAYSLVFRTSGVWPADSYGKYTGRSVRCVAR